MKVVEFLKCWAAVMYTTSPVPETVFAILTSLLLFFSILIPVVSLVKNFIKGKVVRTGETAIKASFILLFLAIVSSSIQILAKDPGNFYGAIINGVGFSLGLLFLFVITLLQIRMVDGKGSIKKFLGVKQRRGGKK